MTKAIAKVGNFRGILLDAALMEKARLKVGDQLNLELHEGGKITLTPIHPRVSRQGVSRSIESTMKNYARTMKKIA